MLIKCTWYSTIQQPICFGVTKEVEALDLRTRCAYLWEYTKADLEFDNWLDQQFLNLAIDLEYL